MVAVLGQFCEGSPAKPVTLLAWPASVYVIIIARPPAATKFWGRGFTRIFTDFYFFLICVHPCNPCPTKILAHNANLVE